MWELNSYKITSSFLEYMKLTKKEIYSIENYIDFWLTKAEMSRRLKRNKSTFTRLFQEYPRESFNADRVIAERKEKQRSSWSSEQRIEPWWILENWIIWELKLRKSPEQIAWRYKLEIQKRWEDSSLSKDTIYNLVYDRYPELKKFLRRKWKKYRTDKKWKYQIQDRVMIQKRDEKYTEEISKRSKLWHWEWDTVIWVNHKSAVGTFLERYSGYGEACFLPEWKNAMWMVDASEEIFKNIPKEKTKTLTFDNGREFAYHTMIQYLTGIEIYFAEPYCSWQRWCNENWNGLLRDYFPKWTDFRNISANELEKVVQSLNSRPRKRLNYLTPDEVFHWCFKSCVPF